jgi:glucokinase
MSIRIAVDLGGTHLRAAAFREKETEPLSHKKIKTRSEDESVFERILGLIQEVMPENEEVSGIGVAVPGPVDPVKGVIIQMPNIAEMRQYPLVAELEAELHVPVYLGNDANLAALGEWRFGAGQGHDHLLYFTISTGVGGGVICDGHLLEGGAGLGAELGHVFVKAEDEGPACGCGHHGHLEALSSGTGIAKYVEWRLTDPETESSLKSSAKRNAVAIAEAARAGDPLAIEAYQRAGHYLGIGVASFLHIFNPSIVILGGGVSQSQDLFWHHYEVSLRANVFNPAYLENLVLTTAALGDDAGLLGALALVETKESL